ncbi:hypothetical protein [Actinoplanes sp. NBRC 101535]|uniref:SCO7613 C-terminal domain-containing membrane protein n=1 Tax=Actinoplanes sp. NBRC 101535 TaxID=3032196 RepID=UPI00255703CF|nr:hypothetical protein [Actinoplanes sp. NBRC 101535]
MDHLIAGIERRLGQVRDAAAGVEVRLRQLRDEAAQMERQIAEARAIRHAHAARVMMPGPVPVMPPPAPAEPRLSALTVQNVLFAMGGLLLLVAAVVFTAVAWVQVGVAGRALLLAGATAAVLAVPPLAVRKGLRAAAETLAAVGLSMILLDGFAAWAVDLAGVQALDGALYAAGVCVVTAGLAVGYARATGLTGPRAAALAIAQPVLPLIAGSVGAELTGWVLALTGVTVLDLVVSRRWTTPEVRWVAHLGGLGAAGLALLLGLADVILQDAPPAAALAGAASTLVAVVLTAWAVLSGNRVAQGMAGGLLVVTAGISAAWWTLAFEGSGAMLRAALVALVIAGAVVPARRIAAGSAALRLGLWVGALVTGAVPAVAVLVWTLVATLRSTDAAYRLARIDGLSWDLPPAALVVAGTAVLLLPYRGVRLDLTLAGTAVAVLLVPASFGLPWWTAAVAGSTVAVAALLLAVRGSVPFRLAVSGAGILFALVVGAGQAAVAAGVGAVIVVAGLGTALIAYAGPRRSPVGVTAVTAGLGALPPTLWLALMAAGTPAPVRVRATFALGAALTAAAPVVVRLLGGYAQAARAVALIVVSSVPLWSASGTDPVVLYAAAALPLIVILRPAIATGIIAALLPVLAVGLLTFTDLAVVLFEPYTTLDVLWSGHAPAQSPVAWSSVAALLIAALAAALLLAPSGVRAAARAATPLLALAGPLAMAAAGAPWPAVPLTALIIGLSGLVALALTPSRTGWDAGLAVLFAVLTAAALAGSAAVHGVTLAAFALLVTAAAITGVAGWLPASRIAGWLAGAAALLVVAYTASDMAGLESGGAGRAELAAALVIAGVEWLLATRSGHPREARAVGAAAHAAAVVALLVSGTAGQAAVIATVWAAVLAVRALRRNETSRFGWSLASGLTVLLGWWLFLLSSDVRLVEAYTLPAAILALVAGWAARRGTPVPSWVAYGPALAAAFVPTMAVTLGAADPQYLRRLLLGLGALAVLVTGARARLQAPVVVGGAVLTLVALLEMARYWDLVPRWVPLALGGLLLVGIATTMEQRRRDVQRLRIAVGRMQ